MKRSQCLFVLVIGAITVCGTGLAEDARPPSTQPARDEQPPLRLTLHIGETRIPVEIGKPFETQLGERSVPARLSAEATRIFRGGGISFEYPAEDTFELDRETPCLTLWTFSGAKNVIMLLKFDADMDENELLDGFAGQYGEQNVERFQARIRLEGKDLDGTRLAIKVAGAKLQQDVFFLPASQGTLALIIQDSLDEDGDTTEETHRVVSMIEKTFRLQR